MFRSNERLWQGAVGFFADEFDMGFVLKKSDELIGRKDGADFDLAIDLL